MFVLTLSTKINSYYENTETELWYCYETFEELCWYFFEILELPLEEPIEVKKKRNVGMIWFQETQRMAMGVHQLYSWLENRMKKAVFQFQPELILLPLTQVIEVEDVQHIIYEYLFDYDKIKRLYEMELMEGLNPKKTVFIFC